MAAFAERTAIIEAVRKGLEEHGAVLQPPAGEASIKLAEQTLGVCLPDTLRQLYGVFGGASAERWHWEIWPPAKLETRPIGSKPAGCPQADWSMYLVFCDVLIWLPAYAVCVDPRRAGDTEVLACIGDRWYRCAPSLDAFFKLLPQQMDDFFIGLLEE